ncbi:MAG: ABC transporter transmembrane domain-containing protein [Pseudomonadota bacterium]
MERSLFSFIWTHSRRDQIILLAVTVLSFPLLYATLELPKRIVNDAIGAESDRIALFGTELSQVQFLGLLCIGFLLAVIASGLMKMQVNTMKGVLAERLLRRFRYLMISRILRFPSRTFRRTSQGELIAMVTSEAEPLGGIMGDAVAQPVFQAGQMLTIMTFLFLQSVWLGLAAVALIPLQAWLIPMLQRRINVLQKQRVAEVRRLAEQIGDTTANVGELRLAGGVPLTLASFTSRLGRLFEIRFQIYQKKFFMKFLNNFITQLTPFFFYSVGGYLAIKGELSVGALVAAIAAYKDIAAPWKELLTYYNQVQEMSLRYSTITERLAPTGMVPQELFEGRPAEIPRLNGEIVLEDVSVIEADGSALLERVAARIPPGSMVAIQSNSALERRAMGELLTREIVPSSGSLTIAGRPLNTLHQAAIAERIGYARQTPYLFNGTIGSNVKMPLRTAPVVGEALPPEIAAAVEEAERTGNSADPADVSWYDPAQHGFESEQALRDWWLSLIEAMGTDGFLFRRGLDTRLDPQHAPGLAETIAELRPEIARRITEAGLDCAVHRFDPERFNPGLAVGGNLLFAATRRAVTPEETAADPHFHALFEELGLQDKIFGLGLGILDVLASTFGEVGTAHPLFLRLGLSAEMFERLMRIDEIRRTEGKAGLCPDDRALVMALPAWLSTEQLGAPFPEAIEAKILAIRKARGEELRARAAPLFDAIEPERCTTGLTILENAIYGKVTRDAGQGAEKLRDLVAEILMEAGLKGPIAATIFDVETGLGGSNLPPIAHERIAFVRAAIKRPDILILDRALASHSAEQRVATRNRLRKLMPQTTLIFLEEHFERPESYDVFIAITDGRPVTQLAAEPVADPDLGMSDAVTKKLRALEKVSLFAGLERAQLRLLAFASRWFSAVEGQYIFSHGDPPDGAYLLVEGTAELRWPNADSQQGPLTIVEPGRLIGDLSVIQGEPRNLDMVAREPIKGLRIGADELRTIIESDPAVATRLLRTVSGYLVEVASRLHDARQRLPGEAKDAERTDA